MDRYVKCKLRPRQREPFDQTNHKRCERRPYVPEGKFERTLDHPFDVHTSQLFRHDLSQGKQQPYNRPRTQDQDPFRPPPISRDLQQWVSILWHGL
jgi:hypothetical protein